MSSFPNEETQFQPGVSGNPAGRPKKTYTQHIADIKEKGYALPTTEEYKDMMLLLLAMTEEDLLHFAKEKERPYWVRLIIIDLNNRQSRQKLMSDHRDWLFGKAKQTVEAKDEVEVTHNISNGQLDQIITILNQNKK